MALTATFKAEFSSFYDAVQKADQKLVDLSRGADRVGTALDRMTREFSGQRVIQEAAIMERAIGGVEGLSKLTQTELQKVGTTAQEAIAKMKALGIDVPAGLQKIADTAKPLPGIFSSMRSALGPLGPLIASTFSVGAIISFGKAVLADADALVKLHDKTGIAYSGLQDLKAIAKESGNSLEQVTGAISMMQNRIAEGDASAVAAIEELGMAFAEFRELAPDQQFRALGAAIKEIEDPADRTRLAMDALGRSGAELLPTLMADMEGIAAGTVKMADEGIVALDRFGDGIERWWERAKTTFAIAAVGTADATTNWLRAFEQKWFAAPDPNAAGTTRGGTVTGAGIGGLAGQGVPLPIGAGPRAIGLPTVGEMKALDAELAKASGLVKSLGEDTRRNAAEAERSAAATQRWHESVRNLTSAAVGAAGSFGAIGVLMPTLVGNTNQWQTQMGLLASRDLPQIAGKLQAMGTGGSSLETLTKKTTDWGSAIGGIGTILSGINSEFAQLATVAARTAENLIKTFGSGDWIGGIMAAVGGGIGLLSGLFRDEETQVNPIRQKFVDAAGGLHELNVKAKEAGVTLTAMLRADTVKEYEAAIKDLNDAFEFQDDAMQQLDDAVKRYGFSIEQLGPTLSKQKLNEQAAQLITDFRLLESAGIDVNHISVQMADSINAYLQNALKTGAAVPEAMREILNQFATMGLLTDENGNKIEDLEEAGVTFAETLDDQFKTLIGTIEKLIEAISRGLGQAIENIPDVDVAGRYTPPDLPAITDTGADSLWDAAAGRGGGGGGVTEIHTHVMLDGREVGRSVDQARDQDLRMRVKGRAA